jgi:integrase
MTRRNRGEGNIKQLPNGDFKARMSYIDGQGRRHRPTAHFPTKKEAVAWLHDQHSKHDRGQLADSGKRTVGQWLAEWLTIKRPQVEPRTYSPWEQHVRLHLTPTIGKTPLAKLRPSHIAAMYSALADKGVSPAMRRKCGNTLTMALTDAVKMGLLANNAATAIRKPKSHKPNIHPLNTEQARAFLAATEQDRLHALYVLAIDSGMRQGELFALCWPEVDFNAGTVTVIRSLEDDAGALRVKDVKSKSSRRRIRLSAVTMTALADQRRQLLADGLYQPDGLVFPDSEGHHLRRPNVIRRSFLPALEQAGLPMIRFHDLRHTNATLLLLSGINIKAVSTRLGHSTVTITLDTYSHVLPQMDEQAASAVQTILAG